MRGADLLVKTLADSGVKHISSLSGNQIMPIYDASIDSGVELYHVRQEAAAVHMADAWGRLTGQPGIALVTAGPGFANALSALYVAKMAESPVKEVALANVRMLADVVEFKQRFYPRAWANYELAKPGSLRLVPEEPVLTSIENDYGAMKDMIFGSLPTFEEMIAVLNNLQNEING